MYLRYTTRRKDGKVHRYWRLVRSVRVGRRVIQQTVAQLGELDARGRLRALARHLIGTPEQAGLFDDGQQHVTVPVRLKGVRVERSRQFGDVYLALALWRGTGLADLCEPLLPSGKEAVPWAKMAAVLVAARLCEPSSELHIAEDWYRRTALGDLLQLDADLVNKDRLYRALDLVLEHKAELEAHLSRRSGELFAVDNEVLLYDVTSTYFEGEAEGNALAQRGYSRDHRGDCKQVCIALVVTFDGFPLGYEVFAGNTHDSRTVQTIVDTMEARHGVAWIADRGMASAANLAWLRLGKTIPRRSSRSAWASSGWAMQRSAARFQITLQVADCPAGFRLLVDHNGAFDEWAALSEGAYVLRTNIADWSDEQLWKAYIQLTQAEAAFRIHKDQLRVRPIWHQREDRVLAHILICFLAFVLLKSLEMWQQRAGLGNSPRTVLEELARIQSHDVILPTPTHGDIRLRCIAQPDDAQALLLDRLGIVLPKRMR